ncbi:right-handed parallel beta-helix repeat-containing protein [Leptodesmis sp.]|uniref:right-handed parallel beta-helix repeat-containing protein n=1 Tax=Leptodesmis sp. TaxID=3100501 RepID=UPI0040534701
MHFRVGGPDLADLFFLVGSQEWRSSWSDAETQQTTYYVAPNGKDSNVGSQQSPWATLNHAAEVVQAGDTVYVRAGTYALNQQIRSKSSGTENAWIVYAAFPGEAVVLDAERIKVPPPSGKPPYPHDQGAFQLENVSYIRVQGLKVINSYNSGFMVRNSHHIELLKNTSENSFSPGIGVWEGHNHKVISNTVINANDPDRGFVEFPKTEEAPHEAISLGGVKFFEVASNLIYNSQKEGIDIKEVSQHGTVHDNHVHHIKRQGLYVDSHFGALKDVEIFNNRVHDCEGAGFVVSVEGGSLAKNIRFHHNLLYNNWGTGIFFSRWGNDGLREDVKIYNNTVYHNGYGKPKPEETFYWITGGLYFFSTNLRNIEVKDNIFSENNGFQIGYSDRYLKDHATISAAFNQKGINMTRNLIFDPTNFPSPIYAGWPPDNFANIYAINGNNAILENPLFVDAKAGNFHLQPNSPAIIQDATTGKQAIGALPLISDP